MDNPTELQNEVSAFASGLGFGPGAAKSGFDDSDFQIQKAKQPIWRPAEGHPPLPEISDRAALMLARKQSNKEAGTSSRQQSVATQSNDANLLALKSRNWTAGMGDRPGAMKGKPLLSKDESTIWHEALRELKSLDTSQQLMSEWDVENLRIEGENLLSNEAAAFEKSLNEKNRADSKWLQQVQLSGTTADKLAAMTILLQESAIANLRSLDELLRWVGKRSGARGMAGEAIFALKDLFANVLLPDRRLLFFEQQPLASLPSGKDRRKYLLYFSFEDAIKKRYLQYVKALQEGSRDNLPFIKEKSMKAMYEMLRSKPEQESLLLTALVDKFGDPSRKIASNAGFLLGELLLEHPFMNEVIAREVERFAFKPHTSARAIYYAAIFLNQLVLSKRSEQGGSALAKRLIHIYFSLFMLILEGRIGNAHERNASDVRRTGGGKQADGASVTKSKAFAAKTPALNNAAAAVDAKLLGALLAGVRRAYPFLEGEETAGLMTDYATPLFCLVHTATFGVAVQALSLVFQILDSKSAVSDRFYRALYSLLLSPELVKSKKTSMFLSLVFKALKADVSTKRTVAFIKRLLQVAAVQMPNFACGCLLLISELVKERGTTLLNPLLEPEEWPEPVTKAQNSLEAGIMHQVSTVKTSTDEIDQPAEGRISNHGGYDMTKREPLFCGAESSCIWEMMPLLGHVHPSVVFMARTILTGMPIAYSGDPMRDLSFSAFLDKFIHKKPKVSNKGSSHMQPIIRPEALSEQLGKTADPGIAPEEAFFFKFYDIKKRREAAGQRPKDKKRNGKNDVDADALGDEDSLVDSDEFSDDVDEFMDGVEESEDEAAAGSYDQLAHAIEDRILCHEPETSSDMDSDVAEDKGIGELAPASVNAKITSSDDSWPGSTESELLDIYDLAGPSDEYSISGGQSESSSEGEWVMADFNKSDSLAQLLPKMEEMRTGLKKQPDVSRISSHRSKRRKTARTGVFAAAEDYAARH